MNTIPLRGVRVHNLRSIDVDIPLGRLTVISGVSGAGKSSLLFDTVYSEAQRRYLQSFSAYTRQYLERFDRPEAELIGDLPPAVAVTGHPVPKSLRATVGTITEIDDYLRLLFTRHGIVTCVKCGQEVRAQQAADVVAAVERMASGTRFSIAFPSNPGSDSGAWAASLQEDGFVRVQVGSSVLKLGEQALPDLADTDKVFVLVDRLETGKFAPQRLTDSVEIAFLRGEGRLALLTGSDELLFDRRLICPRCNIPYPTPEPRLFSFNDPLGACPICHGTGVEAKSLAICDTCRDRRYNDAALSVRLGGRTIADLTDMCAADLADFFREFESRGFGADDRLFEQIRRRLQRMIAVQLGFLTLNRPASTLSVGEARRARLANALGSTLTGAMYLFEEPTAGLHPSDTGKLIGELTSLRDAGNTVVVIEHDLEVIATADHVIDLGPGAGEEGGAVVYQGDPAGLLRCEDSFTAAWLSVRETEAVKRRPTSQGHLRLEGATLHNLQNLSVGFPLGVLCVVTGVSGAGKSTLIAHTLYPALGRLKHKTFSQNESSSETVKIIGAGQIGDVVLMDQEPLTRTARSNPATYLKIFDEIRELFADTSEARIHNFGPGAFSFNQPGGRCDQCEGQGTLTIDMQFLPDVTATCPECQGTRYKKEILNVKVRSLNISEILNLTVREAFRFFRAQRGIEKKLKVLLDVGLEYLRLGQALGTLSGGESQRLKLAGHLASARKQRTLFLMLEPTTGLHLADVANLLECLHRLLDTGHSLIVIEHNLEVIRNADYIIDMGPGSGRDGGRIVATGTPEELAAVEESGTGRCLKSRRAPSGLVRIDSHGSPR
ncbi:MAG: excinuclease ABC subunit UvrA [Planctomycetes bacterium]|nr:excinuclease ABC subunit UvrA [Planctomycetota bacterium]